jgi:LytS/YehU family sensor histidine kinase
MCLQMLVENSIQHNEASLGNPLQISIYTKATRITVENQVHPRTDRIISSKTGLNNIQSRYSFFTSRPVEINGGGKIFQVVLPLISIK